MNYYLTYFTGFFVFNYTMANPISYVAHGKSILAVDGQEVYFYFGRSRESATLNGINIAVKRGIIYSLLGPSGCGKTTLLKCIIGQYKPNAGSIKVYGRSPGSKGFFIPGRGVGYMPQDLALYVEMTAEEILTYFGSLYGMEKKTLNERIAFLIGLLELPDKKRLIQHFSGEQQRLVSFATALIHKPPLLILDEPTVGVDPFLRRAIWNYLVSLAKKERLTVIITTHYTEEARQAHTVGVMRNGRLLVERNPEDMIKECGAFSLEDVFLTLCQQDRNAGEKGEMDITEDVNGGNLPGKTSCINSGKKRNGKSYSEVIKLRNVRVDNGSSDVGGITYKTRTALLPVPSFPAGSEHTKFSIVASLMRIVILTRMNFLRLKRNILFVCFAVFIAAFQATAFFLCCGSGPFNLQVAVSNEDKGLNQFGEEFLNSVDNHTIYQKKFDNFVLAYDSLKRGESWAVLHFGRDYSSCFIDRALEGMTVTNDTIRCSTIQLIVDVSDYIISNTIMKTMMTSFEPFAKGVLKRFGANPLLASLPIQAVEFAEGFKSESVAEFSSAALILGFSFLLLMVLTQMAMIEDRRNGLLGRALAAGATNTEVVLSFFPALLVICLLQLAFMLFVVLFIFKVPCNGPVLWVLIASFLAGICGMSSGFLISAVANNGTTAAIIVLGSFFPTCMLSGFFLPLEAMPYYLRYIASCLPLAKIIEATRYIMARGWNITDNYIWNGYLICSSWIFVNIGLSIILLKIRK